MDTIYEVRNKWDNIYHPLITKVIGAILVFFGTSFLLEFGPLPEQLGMIISIIVALIYCYTPGGAAFLFSCLFFVCTAHINCIFALIIACCCLGICNSNYMQVALAVVTPVCMSITGGMEMLYWCVFVLFIYFSAKQKKNGSVIAYASYYALLLMLMSKFGLGSILFETPTELYKTEAADMETFFAQMDMQEGFNYFIENNLVNCLLIVGVFLVAAQAIYIIFSHENLFAKIKIVDVRELVGFILSIVVLVVVNFIFVEGLAIECGLHVVAMFLQGILAYVVSRPFASKVVQKTFMTKEELANYKEEQSFVNGVIPKDTWDDIAGYENTKIEIKEAIKPYVDKEESKKLQEANMKPIKGILLFGPPGTGKTTIARAIAKDTKMKLIVVSAGEFINKYVGESEKALRNIFEEAKKNAPSLICFDEIESFLAVRNDESRSHEKNIITTFLSQMDGFNELKDVLIVGTTNKPNLIDPAALRPGRFDKIIYVGAPNEDARRALFRRYLNKKANLDLIDMDRLVDNSDRYTGADIRGICEEAYRMNNYMPLTEEDVLAQLSRIRPSYTLDMRDEYNTWSKKFNRSSISEEDYTQKSKNSLTWDDIKGMKDLKDLLKKKIENPLKNMEKYRQYNIPVSNGILFFGPPGCGKTFFAKVVSDECAASFFTINGPELLGGNIGESERNLRRVFREAREAKPSIIFFDEIDAIAQKRENDTGNVRLINQLLTEMDGMESLEGVFVIAATNRPDTLDTALLRAGRFDTKIYIGMPDLMARKDMMESELSEIPTALDFNECAEKLQKYSCADIAGIANKLKEKFVINSIENGVDEPITNSDFDDVIAMVKPSLTEEELNTYEGMKDMESIL